MMHMTLMMTILVRPKIFQKRAEYIDNNIFEAQGHKMNFISNILESEFCMHTFICWNAGKMKIKS